jgi:hypothetical protein
MDFVQDTPTSTYGLSIDLLGLNSLHVYDRKSGLLGVATRMDMHSYTYVDPINGFTNSTWYDMPGDNRDFGQGW